jgi:peptide/nickel transport system substrate-binding protein
MPSRLQVITATLLVACARRHTPDDTLVLVIETPMTSSDPRYNQTNYDDKLTKLVYAGLTTADTPSGEPELDLASALDQIDPLTWDVTLRADAKFSDGTAVTADDVAQTYNSVISPMSDSNSHTGFVERYAYVEVMDARRARLHLQQPLASLRFILGFGIVSFHGHGEGAGPYLLRSLTTTAAELDANPYARHVPQLPHVVIDFVHDAAARTLMLVGGSADLVQNGVRLDLVDDVAAQGLHVASEPSTILTYLMMNNTDPVLRDVRVRRAIALAIDRPPILAAQFAGRAVLATGLLAPHFWAYEPDVARWMRDLPRARALLAEAGVHDLHLVFKTSSDAFRVTIARILAAQLAEAGITVEVRAFEFETVFADIKQGNYQLATMQTSEVGEPDDLYAYFSSSRIPDARSPDSGNRWRYRNAEVDRLTLAGRRELDPVRRKAIYSRVQQILADELPVIPLWHEDNVVLSRPDVEGMTVLPNARFGGLVGASKRR